MIECMECHTRFEGTRTDARRAAWEPYSYRTQQAADEGPMMCPACIMALLQSVTLAMMAAPPSVWDDPARPQLIDNPADVSADTCAVCGASINGTLSGDTTAHWSGPFGTTIIAWTCSIPCAYKFESARTDH